MPAGSPWRMCPSRCPRPPRPPTSASSSTSCWRQRTVGAAAGRPRARSPRVPRPGRPRGAVTARAGPAPQRGPGRLQRGTAGLAPKRCGAGAAAHPRERGTEGWHTVCARRRRPGCHTWPWKWCPQPGTRTNGTRGLGFVTAFKKNSSILAVLKWAG